MLKNYFKIAFRNLFKFKVFSFINICGLALGLACTFVIIFHVMDELNYDKFHENSDSIYKLISHNEQFNFKNDMLSYPSGKIIKNKFAAVKDVTVISKIGIPTLVKTDEKFFEQESIVYADKDLFNVFTFNLIKGNKENQLNSPASVLISEKLAEKYFNNENVINKTISVKIGGVLSQLKVTGVFENLPDNSTLNVEMLLPTLLLESSFKNYLQENYMVFEIFLHVPNSSDVAYLEKELVENRKENFAWFRDTYKLFPFTDFHLYSAEIWGKARNGKSLDDIYIFSTIAFLILLIASINFIILTTSRTSNKGKEIGIRKLVGASGRNIKNQIIGESILTSLISLPFAFLFFELLLPLFNDAAGKELNFQFSENYYFLILVILLTTLLSLVSGVFIATKYSKLKPAEILKDQLFAVKNKLYLRRIFIVTQLSIAVVLIVSSVIIVEQINFLGSKDLGFNKDYLLEIPSPTLDKQKLEIFRKELKAQPEVFHLTSSTHIPPTRINYNGTLILANDPETKIRHERVIVDYEYFETIGVDFLRGRNFSIENSNDHLNSIIVNEEFLSKIKNKASDLEDLVWSKDKRIIGVVDNYHFRGLYQQVRPAVFHLSKKVNKNLGIRISSKNIPSTLNFIQERWNEFNPEDTFTYNFADENFDHLYKQEQNFATIISASSVFAIFITCMGIFGLLLITIEQRKKEIGLWKVMGASVKTIVNLLTKEYLFYSIAATIIASPIVFYFMNKWLNNFAYKISISFTEFIIALVIVLVLTFLTLGIKTIKVASANPVESIRDE